MCDHMDHNLIFVNAAFLNTYGYKKHELLGRSILMVGELKKGSEIFDDVLSATLNGGWQGELLNKKKDGTLFPVYLSTSAIRDESRKPIALIGVAHDISGRKQAEEVHHAIYQLSSAVNRAEVIEEIYEAALTGLNRALGVGRASILLFDDQEVMRFKAWRGLSAGYRKAVDGHSPWSPDENNPQPVLVSDVKKQKSLSALKAVILKEGIQAMAFIPLTCQGRLLGKFMLYYDAPHKFNDEEIELAQTIASHVAFALERKQVEESLEKSLSLLHATIESTFNGILVVDKDGKFTSYNQKFVEMWRLPKSTLASKDDAQALNFALGQLKEPDAFLQKVKYLYNKKDAESFDVLEFKDGRIFEQFSKPQKINEKIVGRVWSYLDVTDRMQAERELSKSEDRYRTLYENNPSMYFTVDAKGTIISANQFGAEQLGYKVDELKGQSVLKVFHKEDKTRVVKQLKKCLENPGQLHHWELRKVRKDGSTL